MDNRTFLSWVMGIVGSLIASFAYDVLKRWMNK